ncbi:hypothetical protein BJY24_007165 [Nocardia transvalensis]|uniref:Uncharacterized protein n=1 Tax=Nocardia transvalensis TaxID=37333 RepID=A0A7W9PM74_9NOCA|nr:hypothetical protein [Nocardia transvalensis]MBB5918253.1 hypothetical protein [Nocardia transvalensis]
MRDSSRDHAVVPGAAAADALAPIRVIGILGVVNTLGPHQFRGDFQAPDDCRAMAGEFDTVHVQLRFRQGGAVLDYRATPVIAFRLATELEPHGIDVRVDDDVTDALADLPHAELWSP